ncbi:MAG: hypothetical protein LIO79_02350 [Rikenellaceae bacterium]|nr:hypothetical protein [Rikenellaceae bacterium]
MQITYKNKPVFELVKSMTKAEKRNFKLYATRLSGNQDAKFLMLFDAFDSLEEYDEAKVLKKCPVKKEQLPNMKAHLYKQLLTSIRLLDVQKNIDMQIRENMDFARILFNKGHYRQSHKLLEKAKELALSNELHTIAIQIIEFQKTVDSIQSNRSMVDNTEINSKEAIDICNKVINTNELSVISTMLYGLYLKLGYVRSEKDIKLVTQYFKPKLDKYRSGNLSFTENVYYFQSVVWYSYIMHDFLTCYKYALKWVNLFDKHDYMKIVMYDNYLRGCLRMLDGLFLLRSHKRHAEVLKKLETEKNSICSINENAGMLFGVVYYYGRMNEYFMQGDFDKGVELVDEIESYLKRYEKYLSTHYKMLFYYKIACMYFGNEQYRECLQYLQKIITSTRDPQVRRDLQCYARILSLIASYEAGIDHNIDYQIKSVYSFLVKMNDMHEVQKEMISFLKRLNTIYSSDFKQELKNLYDRLLPYTSHPYERRSFFYLDITSWLESKIKGIPVAEVIKRNFEKTNRG